MKIWTHCKWNRSVALLIMWNEMILKLSFYFINGFLVQLFSLKSLEFWYWLMRSMYGINVVDYRARQNRDFLNHFSFTKLYFYENLFDNSRQRWRKTILLLTNFIYKDLLHGWEWWQWQHSALLYDNVCCKYERQPFTEYSERRDHVMSFTGI